MRENNFNQTSGNPGNFQNNSGQMTPNRQDSNMHDIYSNAPVFSQIPGEQKDTEKIYLNQKSLDEFQGNYTSDVQTPSNLTKTPIHEHQETQANQNNPDLLGTQEIQGRPSINTRASIVGRNVELILR